MRIVQFASFYTPTSGGLRTCVDELGRGYTDLGHDRVLVVPGVQDRFEHDDSGRRITLASPSMYGSEEYRRLTARRRVFRLLDYVRPDVIEIHDKQQVPFLWSWAKRRDVPTVLLSHERLDTLVRERVPGLPAAVPLRTVVKRVNRILEKRVDHIVTASAYSAAEFVRAGATRVSTIPLGVDLDTFRPRTGARSPFVELVLLSRLSTEKNPDLAFGALRALHESGVPVRLTVVGDGKHRERLEAQSQEQDLAVRFAGHVADRAVVARLVAAADVALCPSGVESFGLATLEALACGTPVVVPPTGALREFVADAVAGVVAPATAAGFAHGVRRLLDVPADERRAAARATAERYPWSETVRRFLALHSSLAGLAVAA